MTEQEQIPQNAKLRTVAINELAASPVTMREVDREGQKYLGICDSIRKQGFFGAITVRKVDEKREDGVKYYVVEGMHRFMAAKDVGLKEINVAIIDTDKHEAAKVMLMGNIHRKQTKPNEDAKMLREIFNHNPMLTITDMAVELGMSPAWIQSRLQLQKIENEHILGLIDGGEITLANAVQLAKLPAKEQEDFVQEARTEENSKFASTVAERLRDIRAANAKGKSAEKKEFKPIPTLQRKNALVQEYETGVSGKSLTKDLTTPLEGWNACIRWVFQMDQQSIDKQRRDYEDRERVALEKREAREAQQKIKAAAKAEELAKKQAAEAAKARAFLKKIEEEEGA